MQMQRRTESTPACQEHTDVFQHVLLEDPPSMSSLTADGRRRTLQLCASARKVCLDCPMFAQCLFDAVVKHDVSGYAAATTHRQRLEIRRRLGVRVQTEDLDTMAGVFGGHRPVDHDEVVRLRNANPYESLETIAHRLGCSLSTVKRHLRKARHEPAPVAASPALPNMMQVLNAFAEVVAPRRTPAQRPVDARVRVSA